ncbi:uncharacterized protein [Periplaneta americana]|uniref:uncharacterized protein isoform X5 n=1 Tax=Periplaneta americana TaxID=6978 RepID=UPI0037E96DEB
MDVIKQEPEFDPLAMQWSDETDTAEKKPIPEEGNLLNHHVAGIKTEIVDHSYDVTSDIKVEETAVPTDFVTTMCKAEKESCDLDTVTIELKEEVTAEENEILTDRWRPIAVWRREILSARRWSPSPLPSRCQAVSG